MVESTKPKTAIPSHYSDWRLFSPSFDDGGISLGQLLEAVRARDPITALEKLAKSIAESFGRMQTLSRRRLRLLGATLILRDLLKQSWSVKIKANSIQIAPPYIGPDADLDGAKSIARQSGLFAREDQLREPAVRNFISSLENPGKGSKCLPITHLIADGRMLANLLQPLSRAPRNDRGRILKTIIRPYIQIAEADQRCALTGIKLTDIWRYFRLNWSIPFNSTPGRNVFILIRDAGQKYHPVMAIAALGNSVMQLTCRDDFLGWTPKGLEQLIAKGLITPSEVHKALIKSLDTAINEIYTEDLPVTKAILKRPNEQAIARLLSVRERAARAREKQLQNGLPPKKVEFDLDTDLKHILKGTRSSLFKLKRAKALAEVLRAKLMLLSVARRAEPLKELFETEDGRMAIGVALRQIRNRRSGASMMELVVCGGVAPYSHLLSGKLACLLMLSPEIGRAYRNKYSRQASVIATQMAGRPIMRPADLVYLGTTSLYSVGSSQYNRVVLPDNATPGQRASISYKQIGITEGYGSAHLSKETRDVLATLAFSQQKSRKVNNVFGEGANPKMRQLTAGFDALGISDAELLRHSSSRLVYSIPLVRNIERYLLEIDKAPECLIPASNGSEVQATSQIGDFWLDRWVSSRLDFDPVFERLRECSPLRLRLSKSLPYGRSAATQLKIPTLEKELGEDNSNMKVSDERIEFLTRLYREESAFSDNVDLARLRELHIRTSLESVIEDLIEQGKSIVLTGNAGDGKTHLIRVLERKLKNKNAWVISDASGVDLDQMLVDWSAEMSNGRPCFVAINEGPLLDLIKSNQKAHPFLNDIEEQLRDSVRYVSVDNPLTEPSKKKRTPKVTTKKIVVIDLSLRQHLSGAIVGPILAKLTEDKWYEGCANCENFAVCGVTYNREALKGKSIQDRVGKLLEQIAIRGEQATFREVLGFCSFLIFGGRTCTELIELGASESARYYTNAFEFGDGHIFDQLRNGLDPVFRTNPNIDAELWNGAFDAAQFRLQPIPVPVSLDPLRKDSLDVYKALKRRWYFEHPDGDSLSPRSLAEDFFLKLMDQNKTVQSRVSDLIRLINRYNFSVDRDYPDKLRLWTKLAYSPRSQSKTMVSGREVPSQALSLFRPVLNEVMTDAFGNQPVDHLLLATEDANAARLANLRIDVRLVQFLLSRSIASNEDNESVRRLLRFNEALSSADRAEGGEFRTVIMVEGKTQREVRLRVDLRKRRYDGVTSSRD